jgi:hypothetical protein
MLGGADAGRIVPAPLNTTLRERGLLLIGRSPKVTYKGNVMSEYDHLPIGCELGESLRNTGTPDVIERRHGIVQHERGGVSV